MAWTWFAMIAGDKFTENDMARFYDIAVSYKLVWIKGFLLIIMPAFMLFDSYTETWSQADWKAQSSFAMIRLGVKMLIASTSAFLGIIDKSISRAEEDLKHRTQMRANGQ